MSFRQLVEPECGGQNALVKLGSHIWRDNALQDEGLSKINSRFSSKIPLNEETLVNEFLGQIAAPPESFRVDTLLKEMREIDANYQPQVVNGPFVIDEVTKQFDWENEFISNINTQTANNISDLEEFWKSNAEVKPREQEFTNEFLENNLFDPNNQTEQMSLIRQNVEISPGASGISNSITYQKFVDFMKNEESLENPTAVTENTEVFQNQNNWADEFQKTVNAEAEKMEDYNTKFWEMLKDEWAKISNDSSSNHPWLTEFSEYSDAYREYEFTEENPMVNDENALDKGIQFLAQGDIPSAVLCFEAAVKQHPENPNAWELLGTTQAENEMDPHAITALKKSIDLNPNNMKALMALAVSYTNESLQSNAVKMLTKWLQCNPKYSHLVPDNFLQTNEDSLASSLIRGPELKETQNLFLEAVNQNPNQIDSEIQEALGVLFNLSSEYDKAADCFRAALQISPNNAKVWNRLGASLANGNRSVEAVDAYQHALEIEPGFIRARYNVGIICMNLKAYKEAAEHLLTALNMQATSPQRSGIGSTSLNSKRNQMSDTIWSTLRMIISLMGRRDLLEIMDDKNLDALNKAFGEI